MTARLYVGTYAKYNEGNLAGAWLDLEDYTDREAFLAACAELHKDEPDAELMFQDYECFPAGFYCESSAPPDELWDWLELSEEDRDMLAAYQDSFYNDGDIEQARDAFQGTYDTEADFAEQLAEEIGAIDPKASHGWPFGCIDWSAAAEELRIGGDYVYARHEGQLYVFRNN